MANLCPMISVDQDRASVIQLLRTYLTAKRMFPNITIDVFVSPSGVGYKIKIRKQVSIEENLKIRALLWDDPVRLAYALKKWALNPDERYIDLCFDEKNDRKETPIDMETILVPYTEEVNKITAFIRNGEPEKAEEPVHELAKKIEPEISKHKKKQYVGCIAFSKDELREQLETICTDIMAKDATFSWRLYPCWFPDFDWILATFADSEQKAWKRITWLKNRARVKDETSSTGWKYILKDADTRLFVKERIAT